MRVADASDASAIAALIAAAMQAAWGEAQVRAELDQPAGRAWLGERDRAGGGPSGVLLARAVPGELEVLVLAVAEDCRRRGIARRLFVKAVEAAGPAGRVFLEVRADNAAGRGFYHALGLAEIGRRPRYYPDGTDAILMATPGTESDLGPADTDVSGSDHSA